MVSLLRGGFLDRVALPFVRLCTCIGLLATRLLLVGFDTFRFPACLLKAAAVVALDLFLQPKSLGLLRRREAGTLEPDAKCWGCTAGSTTTSSPLSCISFTGNIDVSPPERRSMAGTLSSWRCPESRSRAGILSLEDCGCCTGVVGWIFEVMEDLDVLPSPTLADLSAPHDFDQVVPEMIPTPIIISDDESDDVAVPAPIIIISDDDTESDDDVLEIPSVAPLSPITIWSTGTTGETPSYDPAEDHGPSPPTPEIEMPSWSPPLEAFELPIFPMSPGLPNPAYIPMTDEQYELETGWLTLIYQPMESIGDSEDDADMMITDDPFTQPIELPHYQPIFETREPSSFLYAEDATMELPFPEIIYDIGEPSSFPYMETATTELPLPQTTCETGGPSSFPAYAPGGSTYFGDPYATQSFPYGQGSEMFTGAEDGYVDPHGYPYHTTTYLGGSDLYPRCFVCGAMGHLTAVCPRYVELLEIPYLPCARPAGGSTEWGRCPNCAIRLGPGIVRPVSVVERTKNLAGAEMREQIGNGTGGPWLTRRRCRGLNPTEETSEPSFTEDKSRQGEITVGMRNIHRFTDFLETIESKVVFERRTILALKLSASWNRTLEKVVGEVQV
ncbi:hypothetical protein HID58_065219 [Brassica napus]|uniref:CCHC-type domain-containing protein n=1 Tax=Brassica napus TaxID=3708 RepID=A0ABQ7ZCK7_BRANA|nr:hypothetical protein HID58_065219 [Brassica napus]